MVLEASKVLDAEGLARVLPLVASPSNKFGKTRIYPSSTAVERSAGSVHPIFLHSLVAGLVPSFSNFFCEAFLGIMPSVALFRHFYSLRSMGQDEISGNVSFCLEPLTAKGLIPMAVTRRVEDFCQKWVLVDTCLAEPLYQLPDDVPVKMKEWAREPLYGSGLEALTTRLLLLRDEGLTCQMVAKEFLR